MFRRSRRSAPGAFLLPALQALRRIVYRHAQLPLPSTVVAALAFTGDGRQRYDVSEHGVQCSVA
jgi:hypothetical protein